jgi:hypothetical protein
LEKNRDKLYGEGLELLSGSFRLFVRGLVELLVKGGDDPPGSAGAAAEASGPVVRGRRASISGPGSMAAAGRPRGGSVGAARRRGSVGSGGGSGGGGEGKQVSTCTQFKDSLRDLVAQIGGA